jgi:phosphoribosyl-AMP cyclohydrolase
MAPEATAPDRAPAAAPPVPPGRIATPIHYSEAEFAAIEFPDTGLVPAVVQDATDREVLMLGYMDREALRRTLSSGRTWFWSRSRQEYWCKGETSGDRQWVRTVHYDCDGDTLLVQVDQDGRGACHTGARSCFFRAFGDSDGAGHGDADGAVGGDTRGGDAGGAPARS